jgi:ABC-type nickel/cobalt efflux system permease component RcnA
MEEPVLLALGLGFVLGLKHAMDADHVVAVATIVSEQLSVFRAALVGVLWGFGHSAALLAAGGLVVFLRMAIPEPVAALLELAVALMIVILGGRILYLLLRSRKKVHVHAHSHGGVTHAHLHFHGAEDAHEPSSPHRHHGARHGRTIGLRPLLVGMVHGLAGSAALTLLVLTEVLRGGSRILGMGYLLVFAAGSIGGMLLMSVVLSLPFVLTSVRFERVNVPLRLVAGVGSVLFGMYYAWTSVAGA